MEEFLGNALIAAGAFLFGIFVTKLLIDVTIALIEVTAYTVRQALQYRSEMTNNGVMNLVVREFINENNCTVVTLDAFNANNNKVGKVKVSGRKVGVKIGDRIAIA